jgi:hypothetical protein
MSELKNDVERALQNGEEVVQTGQQLADEIGVSEDQLNNVLDDLVEENRIESVEVGTTTAYYIRIREYPTHKKPEHYCSKCGREVYDKKDSAEIEFDSYFTDHKGQDEVVKTKVVCRFCYHDFICWLHDDEEMMHVYPHVEEWDIPQHQLEAVEKNENIQTSYTSTE